MIRVREATEADVEQIRDVFRSTYGDDYAYPQYYDPKQLKKMIFDDDTLILVAEESETGRIAGTASVLLHVGAYADLVGEFGRLAVHAEFRHRGIGRLLMQSRVERVQECLHLGLVENRVVHTFSQAISESQGFVPVGFLPMKTVFSYRESVALFARYFGVALSLRRNNPRIVPEAYRLADRALSEVRVNLEMDDDEFDEFRRSIVVPMIRRHQEMFPQMHRRGSTDFPQSGPPPSDPSFRTRPGIAARREAYPGTDRYAQCPCNSGKKIQVLLRQETPLILVCGTDSESVKFALNSELCRTVRPERANPSAHLTRVLPTEYIL